MLICPLQVLSVRCWRPLKQVVSPTADIVIKRNTTTAGLRRFLAEHVLQRSPEAVPDDTVPHGVGIAKVLLPLDPKPTLPKLTGLNWNDSEVRTSVGYVFIRMCMCGRALIACMFWRRVHACARGVARLRVFSIDCKFMCATASGVVSLVCVMRAL